MAEESGYKVAEQRVNSLLAPDSVAFEVPLFQRRYTWGNEEVEDLLADLYDNPEWLLKAGEATPYFLGSIVLTKGSNASLVLDGQQRLTTLSLILAVFKHKLQLLGHKEASSFDNYLEAGKLGEEKAPKIKLQPEDADDYAALYRNPERCSDPDLKRTRLGAATRAIMASVSSYAAKISEKQRMSEAKALETMASRLIYNVELVRITAPSEAAAFRLFETLNDRGLALSAADLVKNKLFAKCGEPHRDKVRDLWKEMSEAVGESELVDFLRNFMIARGTPARKEKLYDELRKVIEGLKPAAVQEFAKQLCAAAKIYRGLMRPSLESGWNSETVESLKRLNAFRAKSNRPALLACAQLNPAKFFLLVRAVEIVAVRYSIVGGLKPVELEKAYTSMCKKLQTAPNDVESAIRSLSAVVPQDDDFRSSFAKLDIGSVTDSWREILIGLNNTVATGETRVNGPDKVHVEHILPLKPAPDALSEANLTFEEANELSGRIGNLTLLSGKKNQSIGNKEFSHKKPIFEQSEIALNDSIANESTSWGREQIEARSQKLAEDAVKTWPWVFA